MDRERVEAATITVPENAGFGRGRPANDMAVTRSQYVGTIKNHTYGKKSLGIV